MENAEQLYKEALDYLGGKNGFPKNEKKGWKRMEEAAEAGSKDASGELALYLHENNKEAEARRFFEKSKMDTRKLKTAYVECLRELAFKKKKDSQFLEDCYLSAKEYESGYFGDARWYYADIIKLAHPDNKDEIEKQLYLAALGESDMPDSYYQSIGRERGVLADKEEMELWLKAMGESVADTLYLPCVKTPEDAWSTAKANLEEKETKQYLSIGQINRFLSSNMKGILEYQPMVECSVLIGTPSFRMKYDHPSYSTVTTGSGSLKINKYWTNYCASFKTKTTQDNLWRTYKDAKKEKTFCEARVRVSPIGLDTAIERCKELSIKDAANGARNDIKEAYKKEKNWDKQYISIDFDDMDASYKALRYVFVPFYFFTMEEGKNKSVTVRVNAYNGEVDYFVNNPFGQFTAEDNVAQGGGANVSKHQRSARKKSASKGGKSGNSVRGKKLVRLLSNIILWGQIGGAIISAIGLQLGPVIVLGITIFLHIILRKKFL